MSSLDYDPAYRQITDTMQGYADNDAKDRFMQSQTAKILSDKGQDPDIAWEIDALATPMGPLLDDDHILSNTEAPDWKGETEPPTGYVFNQASQEIFDYHYRRGKYASPDRDLDEAGNETYGFVKPAHSARHANEDLNLSPAEISQFGLDFSGTLNFGLTTLGMEYARLRNAPPEVKAAVLAIHQITNSPDWNRDTNGMSWDGTFRLGREIIRDPISYFGFSSIRPLMTAGRTLAGKAGVQNPFMKGIASTLFGSQVVGAESAALAYYQNILQQRSMGVTDIDYDRAKQAALYGYAGGAAMVPALQGAVRGGKAVAGAVIGAADRMAAQGGAVTRMFLGEGSLTADQKALAEAKRMTKAGETPEAIEANTGCALDEGDGKWRYEISDDKATFNIDDADLNVLKARGIEVQTDLRDVDTPEVDKLMGQENYAQGRIFNYDPEVLNLDELRAKNMSPEVIAAAERVDAAMRAQPRKGKTLGDVLNHEELFAAYPWLRDQRVDIDTQLEGGMVRPKDRYFTDRGDEMTLGQIPEGSNTTLRKVGLHEIQHMIQKAEGMAPGGNPEMFVKTPEQAAKLRQALQTFHAARNWLSFSAANEGMAPGRRWSQWKKGYAAANGFEPPKEVRNLNAADLARLKIIEEQTHDVLQQAVNPMNSYLMLAGEIEARNVELRADMTPIERRLTPARETEIETLPSGSEEKLPAHIRDIKRSAMLQDKIYPSPDGDAPGTVPFQLGGQAASPDVRMSKPGKTSAAPFNPELADRLPKRGKPTRETDKKTGKAYTAKGYSKEEKELGKFISRAQKDINAGNYEPVFKVSARTDVDPSKYPTGDKTIDVAIAAKQDTIDKHSKTIVTPEGKKRVIEAYQAGEKMENSADWYFMGQLEKVFISELGAKAGRVAFRNTFTRPMAATTGGASPVGNLRMAAFGNYLRAKGLPYPTAGYELTTPIGGRYVTGNLAQHKKIMDAGGDIDPKLNPKRHNFARNFEGEDSPATIDEQMTSMMTPGKMMPPKGSYAIYEQMVSDIGSEMGVSPRKIQEVAWAGYKGKEKGGYDQSKPMIEIFNEALERTARVTGLSPMEVLKRFIRSDIPLYGLTGLVFAGAADAEQ